MLESIESGYPDRPPAKTGPGVGTRCRARSALDILHLVSILYIVPFWVYYPLYLVSILHIGGQYRRTILHLVGTTSCIKPRYSVLYIVSQPLVRALPGYRSQTSIDHYMLCSMSTTYSLTLYLVSYSIFLLLFILYIVVLRIFRPSPPSLLLYLVCTDIYTTTSWVYTRYCTYVYYYHYILSTALPRPFGLRHPHTAQLSSSHSTAHSAVYSL